MAEEIGLGRRKPTWPQKVCATFQRQKVFEKGTRACNSLPTELIGFQKGRPVANQTWKFLILLLFLGPTENSWWLDKSISGSSPPAYSWEGTLGQEINDMKGTSLSKSGNSACLPTPPRANQWCQRRGGQHHHHGSTVC